MNYDSPIFDKDAAIRPCSVNVYDERHCRVLGPRWATRELATVYRLRRHLSYIRPVYRITVKPRAIDSEVFDNAY